MAEFDRALAIEQITHKLLSYPEHVDRGDFAKVGELFDGVRLAGREPMSAAEFEAEWRRIVLTYEDGLPCTKHVVTNIDIVFDAEGSQAKARSYYTVLQAHPEFKPPIQVVIAGTYHDVFERAGDNWKWVERNETADLFGDLSYHVTADTLKMLTDGH